MLILSADGRLVKVGGFKEIKKLLIDKRR